MFFLFSCSHSQVPSVVLASEIPTFSIHPGEVIFVSIRLPNSVHSPLMCKDQEIKFLVEDNKILAFVSESYFSNEKDYTCYFYSQNIKTGEVMNFPALKITVEKKEFLKEKLNVNPKKVFLSEKDKLRVKKEQARLNIIYNQSSSELLFHKGFEVPLSSKITSIYGTKRIFNNNLETQHLGTDYRASVGVPIPSSNSGRVVLAEDLFYTGYTVILDHGLGVFTMYGHLSKLFVKKDEFVLQGQEIGLSGKTGRASGPHLHWGVKVHKEWVDGDSLVASTRIWN